jgi:hypothetical protein
MAHDNVCTRCGYNYPEDVSLSPMIGAIHKGEVCGICALEMKNAIHGLRDKKFNGEMAELYRLLAVEARANGTAIPPKKEEF